MRASGSRPRISVCRRGVRIAAASITASRSRSIGTWIDWSFHAGGIDLQLPIDFDDLKDQMLSLAARSEVQDGFLYLQVTPRRRPAESSVPHHCKADVAVFTCARFRRRIRSVAVGVIRFYRFRTSAGIAAGSSRFRFWPMCWHATRRRRPARTKRHLCRMVFLSETSSGNLFVVVDETLVTVPVGPRVLPGVTRAVLLELAFLTSHPGGRAAAALFRGNCRR